jgi:hypothetical protein
MLARKLRGFLCTQSWSSSRGCVMMALFGIRTGTTAVTLQRRISVHGIVLCCAVLYRTHHVCLHV